MPGSRRKDISGRVVNGITILSPSHKDSGHNWMWKCRCHCGRTFVTRGSSVVNGTTKGCGCIAIAMKHGKLGTPEYIAWSAMKDRCSNTNNPAYHRYGGRGISVCARWLDFKEFIKDMGDKPSPDHELDRIDNDGNYEPSNCRWATRFQQMRNISKNRLLTKGGETLCLSEWASRLGVTYQTIQYRLRAGLSLEDALVTSPVFTYTCADCGTAFTARERRVGVRVFCSRRCKDHYRNSHRTRLARGRSRTRRP